VKRMLVDGVKGRVLIRAERPYRVRVCHDCLTTRPPEPGRLIYRRGHQEE
jgi:hypothetical protein